MPIDPPIIYVTFGLPGAGKTYAARVFERFGFFVHDADVDLPEDMRTAIATQQPVSDEMRDRFFQNITAHVERLRPEHEKLVVAQTFLKEKYRQRFLDHFPQAQFVLVEADNPIRERRLERRTHQPLDPAYTRRMVSLFEPPYIPHMLINNNADGATHLEAQIAALLNHRGRP
jgi:gluconate kinase